MRIAMILSTHLPPQEGIGFYAWNLASHLTNQGHKIDLITRGSYRITGPQEIDGITIWRPIFLPVYPFHVHFHGLFVTKLVRSLESEIDIIHLHSPLVPVLRTNRPILLTFHSSVSTDVQLTPIENLYTLLMKLQSPISYRLEFQNIKRATRITTVSPWASSTMKQYPNIHGTIEVMWNGVDTTIFKPPVPSIQREKIVLFVGRLESGKGLHELIEAARSVVQIDPEVIFYIVGEGNLHGALEHQIRIAGLVNSIQLMGHISDRECLISMYRKAALFVLPSYHESLPTVLLEAMACGCPVLATKVGGIPNVISDGENGLLISPGDIQELGSGILELLNNTHRSRLLGMQARRTVEENFSWEMITSHYLQQYQLLVHDKKH